MAGLAGHISQEDRDHIKEQNKWAKQGRCYICGTKDELRKKCLNHLSMDAWVCITCINTYPGGIRL